MPLYHSETICRVSNVKSDAVSNINSQESGSNAVCDHRCFNGDDEKQNCHASVAVAGTHNGRSCGSGGSSGRIIASPRKWNQCNFPQLLSPPWRTPPVITAQPDSSSVACRRRQHRFYWPQEIVYKASQSRVIENRLQSSPNRKRINFWAVSHADTGSWLERNIATEQNVA